MEQTLLDRLAARFPDPLAAPPGELPLAYGGNLKLPMLLAAYSRGFFPWFNEWDPILWWSPDPRCILFPDNFRIPTRSARTLKKHPFRLTLNYCFEDVMLGCAAPRARQEGTWVTEEIIDAYCVLHKAGYAHSVEAWSGGQLAGGVYGVSLGRAFFGESMFHRVTEASRAALLGLITFLKQENFIFLDCQQASPHMLRMGATPIPRKKFLELLDMSLAPARVPGEIPWKGWSRKYEYDGQRWHKTSL